MTQEEEKILRVFETRVRHLLLKYKEFESELQNLQQQILRQQGELSALQDQNVSLKKSYDTLKMAKMIEVSGDDVQDAKKKLSKLIRDVDKCIALLNV
jgi:translation initiation factor 2B subunit (eIF-2B alpha/beta/delta family)